MYGITLVNLISGCSIERAWYRRREAPFDAAYRVRVGAGITAAIEDMRRRAGDIEECVSNGT